MNIIQHLGMLGFSASLALMASTNAMATPATPPLEPGKWGSWQTNDKLDNVLYRIAPVTPGRKEGYFMNYPEVNIGTNCYVLDDFTPTLTYPLTLTQMFVNFWVDQPANKTHQLTLLDLTTGFQTALKLHRIQWHRDLFLSLQHQLPWTGWLPDKRWFPY